MEDLWNLGKECGYGFAFSSCTNISLTILLDVLLLLIFLVSFVYKSSSKKTQIPTCYRQFTHLELSSAAFNASLGLLYLGLGLWVLEEMLRTPKTAFPLLCWLPMLFQGFTWLLVSLTVSLRRKRHSKGFLMLWSISALLSSGVLSVFALTHLITHKKVSIWIVSDFLSFPGAILLLLCAYKKHEAEEIAGTANGDDLCTPLNYEAGGSSKTDSDNNVALFEKAGFLSSMSFWWLNPLMVRGKEKSLEDNDIPKLREEDCARSCYSQFLRRLDLQTQIRPSSSPSILRVLIVDQWKGILLSGFFALLKTLILSCGPLFLSAFIAVAEGKNTFKYAGYVLALSLFLAKCLESLSQRQWFFRSRIVGLQVRSLLSAAIYKKQMRLSIAGKLMHSSGEIMNYVTVDAYRIGEFPYWFHQTWTCGLQLCIELVILIHAVGIATGAALVVIALTVLCNVPLGKLQNRFQTKFMEAQGERVKATSEALVNMKVLKLYSWETQFKKIIEKLRMEECRWLSAVQLLKAYNAILFWASPIVISAVTFGACYLLGIPLYVNNVFTFIAALRLVQDPIRAIPDVIGVFIQANVALVRVGRFLDAPELQTEHVRKQCHKKELMHCISIKSSDFSWEENPSKPTLTNINIEVKPGQTVAICGEVGSGKSTLLAAMLGEVPNVKGTIQVYGEIAYVSQTAWIQTGTIQENILFGSAFNKQRYQETLEKCSLLTDLEVLPYGDLTEIGERGVNLSGGQKQRIQLARALYQDADIYLLDDPFSAVDAHTATQLFNEYVMEALSGKTVILVTHQVDFLPAFDIILLLSNGGILHAAPYLLLLTSSREFWILVNAHKETAGSEGIAKVGCSQKTQTRVMGIMKASAQKQLTTSVGDQLIKIEEKETGNVGLRPYLQYLNDSKGYVYFSFICLLHFIFTSGQILQNSWMAANVDNPHISEFQLIVVYLIIGFTSTILMVGRFLFVFAVGMWSSKSLFSQLLKSLFRAPMSFYESTPLGRILTRISSDLSIVDLDIAFTLTGTVVITFDTYAILGVLATVTWEVLFVSIPMVYLAICLQRYYFASAKELMRINGTTKSMLANHLAESIAGAMTIRAYKKEELYFAQNLDLIDKNASPFFHNFAANEWLILRLEILSSTVISSAALAMILLPPGTLSSGFIGLALSYGLSLNMALIYSIQSQCTLSNYIISVERLNQYMHIPPEAPEVRNENRPAPEWPAVGRVEIHDLKIKYRPDTPLVLSGISCIFEGGHKIGIVGRTGSGKTTLISALFRLVEPAGGKIVIDGIDISTLGLHDLRRRIGIIPQDPILFNGTVRYNLDPLSQHTDFEIWKVLKNCRLQEAIQDKEEGLDASVVEDGSNWSMGHRQLFCLGRALLRRNQILVLDEATASIDNTTDAILQRAIRTEFADCTVITVAHRIPTVMDCTMVLAISNGNLVEYDEPLKLMNQESSLFGELVKEYWSRSEVN